MAEILKVTTLHDGWSKFMLADVRLDDGAVVSREIEQHKDATAVLPYDPERRLGVLVRLLRPPVLFMGRGANLIEALAGIIDDGESAETAARREAGEEAGLKLDVLEPVATVWSSPGVSTETIALYLAPYRRDAHVGQGGGAPGEHENITVIERPLAELWAMTLDGRISDLKTLALLMALRLRQPQLFEPLTGSAAEVSG